MYIHTGIMQHGDYNLEFKASNFLAEGEAVSTSRMPSGQGRTTSLGLTLDLKVDF